jgi:hypothetical protein
MLICYVASLIDAIQETKGFFVGQLLLPELKVFLRLFLRNVPVTRLMQPGEIATFNSC